MLVNKVTYSSAITWRNYRQILPNLGVPDKNCNESTVNDAFKQSKERLRPPSRLLIASNLWNLQNWGISRKKSNTDLQREVHDKLCEKDFFTYNPGRAPILGLKTCRNIHKDNRNKKTFKLYLADSKFESENFKVFPYSVFSIYRLFLRTFNKLFSHISHIKSK